jgi:hypothetical protein
MDTDNLHEYIMSFCLMALYIVSSIRITVDKHAYIVIFSREDDNIANI